MITYILLSNGQEKLWNLCYLFVFLITFIIITLVYLQAKNSFLITTNLLVTRKQKQGICEEVSWLQIFLKMSWNTTFSFHVVEPSDLNPYLHNYFVHLIHSDVDPVPAARHFFILGAGIEIHS